MPVGALTRGSDWVVVAQDFRAWIEADTSSLADGYNYVVPPAVPFPVHAWKSSHSPPGLFLQRSVDSDAGFVEMLQARLPRKCEKLATHRDFGETTVLLLESRCVAPMSHGRLRKKLFEAFPAGIQPAPDQVWFADWACEAVPSYWRLL